MSAFQQLTDHERYRMDNLFRRMQEVGNYFRSRVEADTITLEDLTQLGYRFEEIGAGIRNVALEARTRLHAERGAQ